MQKKAIIDPLGNLYTVDGQRVSLHHEPKRWRMWLDNGQPFRFQGLHEDGYAVNLYSARAKIIKGHRFWYAERKQNGRTLTVYLGKTDAITLARLRWAIVRLREHGARTNAQEAELENMLELEVVT